MRRFKDYDFSCPCCGLNRPEYKEHQSWFYHNVIVPFRRRYGEDLILTSAVRCLKHNKAVNGAENSLHLTGKAFDVAIPDYIEDISKGNFAYSIVEFAMCAGFKQIIIYHNHIHIGLTDDRYLARG